MNIFHRVHAEQYKYNLSHNIHRVVSYIEILTQVNVMKIVLNHNVDQSNSKEWVSGLKKSAAELPSTAFRYVILSQQG